MRGFEFLLQSQQGVDYTSFDLARHAMEQGDITAMRFPTGAADYFGMSPEPIFFATSCTPS
jgi:hypothetical protein